MSAFFTELLSMKKMHVIGYILYSNYSIIIIIVIIFGNLLSKYRVIYLPTLDSMPIAPFTEIEPVVSRPLRLESGHAGCQCPPGSDRHTGMRVHSATTPARAGLGPQYISVDD